MFQTRLNQGSAGLYARVSDLIDPDSEGVEEAMVPWEKREGGNLRPITGQC